MFLFWFLRTTIKFSTRRYYSTITMTASSSTSLYAAMPKVELHVHADGACRLGTLQDLSRQYGCPYPHDDIEKFRGVVTLPKGSTSLTQFLSVFGPIANILRTKESLERIAFEFCEDCANQNIVYAEYRYNPFPDLDGHPSGKDYCEGIISGLDRGQKQFDVKVHSILCFMREDPESVMDIVRLADIYQSRGVVGVDIAGDELLPLDSRHVAGFKEAKKLDLHVTAHAAESGPASNVKEAVEQMGAERIGHGYHVIDDDDIYQFAKEKGLHFETCPSSSVCTKSSEFEDHAIKLFAKDGVSFSLNTDDPGVIGCDLTGECDISDKHIGLTKHQIMRSVVCGAEAAFLPPNEKADLVKTVKEKLKLFDPTFSS